MIGWACEWDLSDWKNIPFGSHTDHEHFSVHYYQTVKIDNRIILVELGEKTELTKLYSIVFWPSERLQSHLEALWTRVTSKPLSWECTSRDHITAIECRDYSSHPGLRMPETSLLLLLKVSHFLPKIVSTQLLLSHLLVLSEALRVMRLVRLRLNMAREDGTDVGHSQSWETPNVYYRFLMLDNVEEKNLGK